MSAGLQGSPSPSEGSEISTPDDPMDVEEERYILPGHYPSTTGCASPDPFVASLPTSVFYSSISTSRMTVADGTSTVSASGILRPCQSAATAPDKLLQVVEDIENLSLARHADESTMKPPDDVVHGSEQVQFKETQLDEMMDRLFRLEQGFERQSLEIERQGLEIEKQRLEIESFRSPSNSLDAMVVHQLNSFEPERPQEVNEPDLSNASRPASRLADTDSYLYVPSEKEKAAMRGTMRGMITRQIQGCVRLPNQCRPGDAQQAVLCLHDSECLPVPSPQNVEVATALYERIVAVKTAAAGRTKAKADREQPRMQPKEVWMELIYEKLDLLLKEWKESQARDTKRSPRSRGPTFANKSSSEAANPHSRDGKRRGSSTK